MAKYLTCSYDKILSSRMWTVDALILSNQQLINFERKPLVQLAEINVERVKPNNIQDEVLYPYVEIQSIDIKTGGINPSFKTGKSLPSRAKFIAKTGDILLSLVRPERSIVAIVPEGHKEYIVSNSLVVLTPKKGVDTETLFSMLKAEEVTNELKLMTTGTTIPSLSLKQIKEYELPVSNTKFGNVSYIRESTAPHLVDSNSTVKFVSYNEIIEESFQVLLEYEKIENKNHTVVSYSELTSSDRFDVGFYIDQLNHQVKWKEHQVKLGSVVEDIRVGRSIPTTIKNSNLSSNSVRYLTVKNVSYDSVYTKEDDVIYIDSNHVPTDSGIVEENNIVVVRQGFKNLGLSALVSENFKTALANHLLMIVKVNEMYILPKYLVYFLRTKWATQQIKAMAVAKNNRFLSQNALKHIVLPLPDMKKQQDIINQIEHKFATHSSFKSI